VAGARDRRSGPREATRDLADRARRMPRLTMPAGAIADGGNCAMPPAGSADPNRSIAKAGKLVASLKPRPMARDLCHYARQSSRHGGTPAIRAGPLEKFHSSMRPDSSMRFRQPYNVPGPSLMVRRVSSATWRMIVVAVSLAGSQRQQYMKHHGRQRWLRFDGFTMRHQYIRYGYSNGIEFCRQ